jgi:hypothetical protein
MTRLKHRLASFHFSSRAVPFLFLLVAVLSYGILFNRLGYFWDEWPIQWIANRLGPQGLALYFETNRPFWGLIYRATTALLGGDYPWIWQLFGLTFHWLIAWGLWLTIRQVWPRAEAAALWVGLLFLVYPGFRQSPIAFMYGHFFVAYAAFTWSLALGLIAARRGGFQPFLTGAAVLLSLINLLSLEYFFVLELLRPLLFFIASNYELPLGKRLLQALKAWLPYLAVFLGVVLWRTVIFSYQTHNYKPALLSRLAANPAAGLSDLAGTIFKDLGVVLGMSWDKIFTLPTVAEIGPRSFVLWLGVMLFGLIAFLVFIFKQQPIEIPARRTYFEMAAFGLVALIAGGLPFWVTDLPVGIGFPNDRFILPFIIGASILIVSLIMMFPFRRGGAQLGLAALVCLCIGFQFLNSVAYQRDWNTQRALFWQMSWRIPALTPGTALVTSQMPLKYFSDNSLAAPLNWIYDTDRSARAGGMMDYMFYDAAVRTGRALKLEPGQPITQGYLAAEFKGNSDRLVVFDFKPPACFRILDPDLDPLNPTLTGVMREAAAASTLAPIDAGPAVTPEPSVFGPEPEHGWCYFYQKADLARQSGDWAAAGRLADEAFASGDYPNDPSERLLFIEIYAHLGKWDQAVSQTVETVKISGLFKASLARLWQRIESQTMDTPERAGAISALRDTIDIEP